MSDRRYAEKELIPELEKAMSLVLPGAKKYGSLLKWSGGGDWIEVQYLPILNKVSVSWVAQEKSPREKSESHELGGILRLDMRPLRKYLIKAMREIASSDNIVHRVGSNDLRKRVIRLAHSKPELRKDLLPMLAKGHLCEVRRR